MSNRNFKNNKWDMPAVDPAVKNSVNRKSLNRCPNCDHIHSIGDMGVGTHIEVKCGGCKAYFYITKL
jgi:hypothetical protein